MYDPSYDSLRTASRAATLLAGPIRPAASMINRPMPCLCREKLVYLSEQLLAHEYDQPKQKYTRGESAHVGE
jgi:hypothetical protein